MSYRPLWVVLGLVALVLIARFFYVPKSFGVHERGYMYGWYGAANIEDWEKVTVKYRVLITARPVTLTSMTASR